MEKKQIREKLLKMRRELTSKYIEDASRAVYEKFIALDAVKQAYNVLVYSNFDNEVKTADITGWLLYNGKNVYLPAIEQKTMYAADIKGGVLQLSGFGVAQPDLRKADAIAAEKLDLIVVPGIAFDRKKNRIGFGMGYYDAFLKQTKAYRLALAFEFQVMKEIPSDAHDEAMDAILTPEDYIV